MALGSTLEAVLRQEPGGPGEEVAAVVRALAEAAIELSNVIARGALLGEFDLQNGTRNAAGDGQCMLDLVSHHMFIAALRDAPVAVVVTEESEEPVGLNPGAPLVVAIDPLDGSSNVGVNIPVGTIFSILPSAPSDAVLRPGSEQRAAGFFIYGPQTALVLGTDAVRIFTLDRETGAFRLTRDRVSIPRTTSEFAINASNYRHWDEGIRSFIDDCLDGADGPRGKDFNMRWIASLVAEAYRILVRGGVFLYPADRRPSYEKGRLRLLYGANPIAFIVEKAGGAATDGVRRILDVVPAEFHERTPLVFGSATKVDCIARYHERRDDLAERSPLFSQRGLLRV